MSLVGFFLFELVLFFSCHKDARSNKQQKLFMYFHCQGSIRQALNFNHLLRKITSTITCTEETLRL